MSTAHISQYSIENNYAPEATDAQAVTIFLADSSLTAWDDTWKLIGDVTGKLATTGSYNGTSGIAAGNWPWKKSGDGSTVEISLPASTWTSTGTYSLSFRWVIFCLYGTYLLTAVDLGSTQTLSAASLQLTTAESADIAGSYPIYRIRKS